MERSKVKEFVKLYVNDNHIIHLYSSKYIGDKDPKCDYEYKRLWHGMAWQCSLKHCVITNSEMCPYNNYEVLEVLHFNHGDISDEIDLLIKAEK